MYWQHPYYLWGLWILPGVAVLLFHAHRRRIAAARQFADPAMVERLMPPLSGPRPWIQGILVLAGLALLVVALARPRFGVYFEKVAQRGIDLYVAVDVSRSMDAEDIAPSRLKRAKFEIQDLLTRLVGDRVGLIVFAGKPVVKVPLTTDYGFFQMVLDEVSTTSAPRGGTMIGDAIRKAMEAMPERQDRDRVIVLITDGEDHDSYPLEAAEQAADAGIKIFTVALGDANEGARIPIRDEKQGLQYLKDNGELVWSKVNDRLLKEIALGTQGVYIPSAALADGLGQIYDKHLADLAQGEIQEEKRKRYREQFQLFVGLGLALLLIEMMIPNYPRTTRENHTALAAMQGAAKAAAVLFGTIWIAGFPQTGWAGTAGVSDSVDRGIAYFKSGEYQKARSAFQDADLERPDDPWITYDLATAHAAQGDARKAEELFREAALTRDQDLAARCHYNLGTLAAARARALFGDKPDQATPEVRDQGLALLAEAVAHYRDCIQIDADHADARHNLEVIRLWMKSMQALWEERDRQKDREAMDLIEWLTVLEAKERNLRAATQTIAEEPDSPRRRHELAALAKEQRQLSDEIEPLKDKIAETLQTPPQQGMGPARAPPQANPLQPSPPNPSAPDPSIEQGIKILQTLADQVGDSMRNAASNLDTATFDAAVQDQRDVIEKLDQIYLAVVPFPALLQRAIRTQQELVDRVAPAAAQKANAPKEGSALEVAAEENTPREDTPTDTDSRAPSATEDSEFDFQELAWNQEFITGWAQVLGPKAAQGLKSLETMGDGAALADPDSGPPHQPGSSPEAARERIDGLKESMQKAVELAPRVESRSADAVTALREIRPREAQPKQESALQLLKEIAEPLPKQDPSPQDDQQQNQKDQKKQDPKHPSDPNQGQDNQQDPQQRQRDLSKQQAESLIRQVRERQQKRKDMEQQLQRVLASPGVVDKDW